MLNANQGTGGSLSVFEWTPRRLKEIEHNEWNGFSMVCKVYMLSNPDCNLTSTYHAFAVLYAEKLLEKQDENLFQSSA